MFIYIKPGDTYIHTSIYKKKCSDTEVSRENVKIWAENGNSKRKHEVKLSAKADNSESSDEGGFKQGKIFSENDGLYVQNLAMIFLHFKKNFLGRLLKTGISKTGKSYEHATSVNKIWRHSCNSTLKMCGNRKERRIYIYFFYQTGFI